MRGAKSRRSSMLEALVDSPERRPSVHTSSTSGPGPASASGSGAAASAPRGRPKLSRARSSMTRRDSQSELGDDPFGAVRARDGTDTGRDIRSDPFGFVLGLASPTHGGPVGPSAASAPVGALRGTDLHLHPITLAFANPALESRFALYSARKMAGRFRAVVVFVAVVTVVLAAIEAALAFAGDQWLRVLMLRLGAVLLLAAAFAVAHWVLVARPLPPRVTEGIVVLFFLLLSGLQSAVVYTSDANDRSFDRSAQADHALRGDRIFAPQTLWTLLFDFLLIAASFQSGVRYIVASLLCAARFVCLSVIAHFLSFRAHDVSLRLGEPIYFHGLLLCVFVAHAYSAEHTTRTEFVALNKLAEDQQRQDKILDNMLPPRVVVRLRDGGERRASVHADDRAPAPSRPSAMRGGGGGGRSSVVASQTSDSSSRDGASQTRNTVRTGGEPATARPALAAPITPSSSSMASDATSKPGAHPTTPSAASPSHLQPIFASNRTLALPADGDAKNSPGASASTPGSLVSPSHAPSAVLSATSAPHSNGASGSQRGLPVLSPSGDAPELQLRSPRRGPHPPSPLRASVTVSTTQGGSLAFARRAARSPHLNPGLGLLPSVPSEIELDVTAVHSAPSGTSQVPEGGDQAPATPTAHAPVVLLSPTSPEETAVQLPSTSALEAANPEVIAGAAKPHGVLAQGGSAPALVASATPTSPLFPTHTSAAGFSSSSPALGTTGRVAAATLPLAIPSPSLGPSFPPTSPPPGVLSALGEAGTPTGGRVVRPRGRSSMPAILIPDAVEERPVENRRSSPTGTSPPTLPPMADSTGGNDPPVSFSAIGRRSSEVHLRGATAASEVREIQFRPRVRRQDSSNYIPATQRAMLSRISGAAASTSGMLANPDMILRAGSMGGLGASFVSERVVGLRRESPLALESRRVGESVRGLGGVLSGLSSAPEIDTAALASSTTAPSTSEDGSGRASTTFSHGRRLSNPRPQDGRRLSVDAPSPLIAIPIGPKDEGEPFGTVPELAGARPETAKLASGDASPPADSGRERTPVSTRASAGFSASLRLAVDAPAADAESKPGASSGDASPAPGPAGPRMQEAEAGRLSTKLQRSESNYDVEALQRLEGTNCDFSEGSSIEGDSSSSEDEEDVEEEDGVGSVGSDPFTHTARGPFSALVGEEADMLEGRLRVGAPAAGTAHRRRSHERHSVTSSHSRDSDSQPRDGAHGHGSGRKPSPKRTTKEKPSFPTAAGGGGSEGGGGHSLMSNRRSSAQDPRPGAVPEDGARRFSMLGAIPPGKSHPHAQVPSRPTIPSSASTLSVHAGDEGRRTTAETVPSDAHPMDLMAFEMPEAVAYSHDNVSVLFCYVKELARHATTCPPMQLVSTLNALYKLFDQVTERLGVYKVLAIADLYLCVCGAPDPDPNHHVRIALAAGAFLTAVRVSGLQLSGEPILIQIGLHCGPVAAGVIGRRTFNYHIFGDTVNVASRMCSTAQPMRIQVTEEFFLRLGERDPSAVCGEFLARGEIEVKGKGRMRTFWLEPREPRIEERTDSLALVAASPTVGQSRRFQSFLRAITHFSTARASPSLRAANSPGSPTALSLPASAIAASAAQLTREAAGEGAGRRTSLTRSLSFSARKTLSPPAIARLTHDDGALGRTRRGSAGGLTGAGAATTPLDVRSRRSSRTYALGASRAGQESRGSTGASEAAASIQPSEASHTPVQRVEPEPEPEPGSETETESPEKRALSIEVPVAAGAIHNPSRDSQPLRSSLKLRRDSLGAPLPTPPTSVDYARGSVLESARRLFAAPHDGTPTSTPQAPAHPPSSDSTPASSPPDAPPSSSLPGAAPAARPVLPPLVAQDRNRVVTTILWEAEMGTQARAKTREDAGRRDALMHVMVRPQNAWTLEFTEHDRTGRRAMEAFFQEERLGHDLHRAHHTLLAILFAAVSFSLFTAAMGLLGTDGFESIAAHLGSRVATVAVVLAGFAALRSVAKDFRAQRKREHHHHHHHHHQHHHQHQHQHQSNLFFNFRPASSSHADGASQHGRSSSTHEAGGGGGGGHSRSSRAARQPDWRLHLPSGPQAIVMAVLLACFLCIAVPNRVEPKTNLSHACFVFFVSAAFSSLRSMHVAAMSAVVLAAFIGLFPFGASGFGPEVVLASVLEVVLGLGIALRSGYAAEAAVRTKFLVRHHALVQNYRCQKLLKNMLPLTRHVELLMRNEEVVETLGDVTLLYSDIVGFTKLSTQLSPPQLIRFLHEIYSSFDELLDRYDLYKIDTVGDAFIVVGGLRTSVARRSSLTGRRGSALGAASVGESSRRLGSSSGSITGAADQGWFSRLSRGLRTGSHGISPTNARRGSGEYSSLAEFHHPAAVAHFAMDMIDAIYRIREENNLRHFNMRIGIHTGSVVGGILGSSRPRYFIWGEDTVIGNAMESNSVPGQVTMSKATYERLELSGGFGMDGHRVVRVGHKEIPACFLRSFGNAIIPLSDEPLALAPPGGAAGDSAVHRHDSFGTPVTRARPPWELTPLHASPTHVPFSVATPGSLTPHPPSMARHLGSESSTPAREASPETSTTELFVRRPATSGRTDDRA